MLHLVRFEKNCGKLNMGLVEDLANKIIYYVCFYMAVDYFITFPIYPTSHGTCIYKPECVRMDFYSGQWFNDVCLYTCRLKLRTKTGGRKPLPSMNSLSKILMAMMFPWRNTGTYKVFEYYRFLVYTSTDDGKSWLTFVNFSCCHGNHIAVYLIHAM